MIEKAKLKVLHNITVTKQPTMLYQQLKIPERKTKAITVRYNEKKEKLRKFFLMTMIDAYNKIPVLMKNLDQQKFKKAITKIVLFMLSFMFFGINYVTLTVTELFS